MHAESLDIMGRILDRFRSEMGLCEHASILDVGSMDVNGTYRQIVESRGFTYTGLDVASGRNVDIVDNAYTLRSVPDESYDAVISGQALEHMQFPLLAVLAMKRVLRAGGCLGLIAPFSWPEHKYPIDCWRIVPDGMRFLLDGFELTSAGKERNDCWGVGRKPYGYQERWVIMDRVGDMNFPCRIISEG